MTIKTTLMGLAAGMALAGATQAATVSDYSSDTYSDAAYSALLGTLGGVTVEDFEGAVATPTQVSSPYSTAVGTLSTIGGTGTGKAVTGDGTDLALVDGKNFGRKNTTAGGSWFLDSNDTLGIVWDVFVGGKVFDTIAFSLGDVADAGATFTLFVNGIAQEVFTNQANGSLRLVTIQFSEMVSSATIRLESSKLNDGFSIDDLTVNAISAVPLPAGGLLLISGLGGLALMRRRRKAA